MHLLRDHISPRWSEVGAAIATWQGDVLHHLPLAMNDEFPRTPVKVVELHGNYFSGT